MSGVWVAVGTAVVGAYSGYQSAKAQKEAAAKAAQATTKTSSPYMAERINPVIPYIMSEAQKIYGSRMGTYGLPAGDFSEIAKMLQGVPSSYTGVGGLGGDPAVSQFHSGSPFGSMDAEELAAFREDAWSDRRNRPGSGNLYDLPGREEALDPGMGMGGGGGMGDLINYWEGTSR